MRPGQRGNQGSYANICEIGKERIRRAGAQISTGNTGFRVFKLDSSNPKTWDAAPLDPQAGDMIGELADRMNAMIHRVKPDRSDLDMVFEVMLKLGVPLDFPVAEVSPNDKTAYIVGEGCRCWCACPRTFSPGTWNRWRSMPPPRRLFPGTASPTIRQCPTPGTSCGTGA